MEFTNKDIRKNIECYVGFLKAIETGTNDAREYLDIIMDSNIIDKDSWGIATRNCHNEQDMRDIALQFLVGDIICASGLKPWENEEEDINPESVIILTTEEKEI